MTDAFRTYYDAARAVFPPLPQWYVLWDDCVTPEYRGRVGTMPQFCAPKNYTLSPDEPAHEAGHLYFDLLGPDAADRYWTMRGFPGTWQQALDASLLKSGNEAFQTDPRESFAECFALAVVPTHVEKTLTYGKDIDAVTARMLLQSLAPLTVNIEWRGPLPTSNYLVGRQGNPTTLIVDHWMAGTWQAADSRFKNATAIVSAHFGVTQDGRILQWVSENDTAYHAGDWDVNVLSIGIEHEASPTVPPSEALYAASARLHRYLADKHGIALEVGATVRPHRAIVATACPGTLDLDRIVKEANGGDMAFISDPDAIAYRADVKATFDDVKKVLAALATQNKVEDDTLAALGARIDKLHAI